MIEKHRDLLRRMGSAQTGHGIEDVDGDKELRRIRCGKSDEHRRPGRPGRRASVEQSETGRKREWDGKTDTELVQQIKETEGPVAIDHHREENDQRAEAPGHDFADDEQPPLRTGRMDHRQIKAPHKNAGSLVHAGVHRGQRGGKDAADQQAEHALGGGHRGP
jgi:hypothetical protein